MLLDAADAVDADQHLSPVATEDKVVCPNCGEYAHPRWWPSGYNHQRDRLNPALWSHAVACGDEPPAKRQRSGSGGGGGGGGRGPSGGGGGGSSGGGGGGSNAKQIEKLLDEAQAKLDAIRKLTK